jgi:hypothetical protein
MTRLNRWLLLALGAQVVLFGALFALCGRGGGERAPARVLLADLQPAAVDRLEIEAEDGARIELAREGAGWVLPGKGGYQADGPRVERLLGQLLALRPRLLVARGAGHQADLEVAVERFRRKLVLRSGANRRELFVGGRKAGYTQVRLGEEADTYGVDDLDEWQLPTAPLEWLDKGYLQAPRERLVRLEIARGDQVLSLERAGAAEWRLGEATVPARKAEELVSQAVRLEPVDVLGELADPAVKARVDQGKGAVRIRLGLSAAGEAAAEEKVLHVAAHPDKASQVIAYLEGARFAVAADRWRLERLLDLDPVELLKPDPVPDLGAEPPVPGMAPLDE